MKQLFLFTLVAILMSTIATMAQTEIQYWHAFTGRLGELLNAQVDNFNSSQSEYKVVTSYKGTYAENLNAGIAAFRGNRQPHILMVHDAGTATMMTAREAIKPVYEVMTESGVQFDPDDYIEAVKGFYTTADGLMLSLPYNSSTPILWVNVDRLKKAGIDSNVDLSTWQKVGIVLDQLKVAGEECPLVSGSSFNWEHLENYSAYHNVPYATKNNGFAGLDAELLINGEAQVAHIKQMGIWAREGKFIYAGRLAGGGASFRAGECALNTQSSAAYAGIKSEAQFEFAVRPLPYWEGIGTAPQNTTIGGASLWVMEGHDDSEYIGVGKFLSYLSTTSVQEQWHKDSGYFPITTAAAESTRKSGFYDENPGTDVGILQVTRNKPTVNSKGLRLGLFDQIRSVIDEELEAVWVGDKSAQEALNSAVKRGNQLLRRFEQSNR